MVAAKLKTLANAALIAGYHSAMWVLFVTGVVTLLTVFHLLKKYLKATQI